MVRDRVVKCYESPKSEIQIRRVSNVRVPTVSSVKQQIGLVYQGIYSKTVVTLYKKLYAIQVKIVTQTKHHDYYIYMISGHNN